MGKSQDAEAAQFRKRALLARDLGLDVALLPETWRSEFGLRTSGDISGPRSVFRLENGSVRSHGSRHAQTANRHTYMTYLHTEYLVTSKSIYIYIYIAL